MIIYEAINKINGKKYIGQTSKKLEERIKGHIKQSKSENIHYFQRAIRKYGVENFEWRIICQCSSLEEANELEMFYIAKHETSNPEKGYNETVGGSGVVGNTLTEEKKRQISEAVKTSEKFIKFCKSENATIKKSETMKGRKFSDKHRKNLSKAAKERKLSDEGKEKLSKAMKNSDRHQRAIHSEEYRKKMSEISKKKWQDPEFREKMMKARNKK